MHHYVSCSLNFLKGYIGYYRGLIGGGHLASLLAAVCRSASLRVAVHRACA